MEGGMAVLMLELVVEATFRQVDLMGSIMVCERLEGEMFRESELFLTEQDGQRCKLGL